MGEPTCLIRSFSSNSMPHQPTNQANHVHALGGSITSREFMSESLDCEKWSNVPKKWYVEEAKSYTQPGSVAEKKAFFDAYYKKIAAQKAAAAALLEQEKAAAANAHQLTSKAVDLAIDSNTVDVNTKNKDSLNIRRPLLKSKAKADKEVTQPIIKNKPASSSWVASIHHKKLISTPRTKNVITSDYNDRRRLTPKSLTALGNYSFVQESCRKTQSTNPTSSVSSTPKRGVTPKKTPAKAFVNGVNKQPLTTLSVDRSKLKSPAILSPFMLRTDDRAARRKQKLEEKFNEKQAKVVQQKAQFKEKAESEFRKMSESFCFKALQLPDFYKGRETPEANPKPFTPRRITPSSAYSVRKMYSRRLGITNN